MRCCRCADGCDVPHETLGPSAIVGNEVSMACECVCGSWNVFRVLPDGLPSLFRLLCWHVDC